MLRLEKTLVKSIQVFRYLYPPTTGEVRLKIGTRRTIKRKVNEDIETLKKTIEILSNENKELKESIPKIVQTEIDKLEERMTKREEKMKRYLEMKKKLTDAKHSNYWWEAYR